LFLAAFFGSRLPDRLFWTSNPAVYTPALPSGMAAGQAGILLQDAVPVRHQIGAKPVQQANEKRAPLRPDVELDAVFEHVLVRLAPDDPSFRRETGAGNRQPDGNPDFPPCGKPEAGCEAEASGTDVEHQHLAAVARDPVRADGRDRQLADRAGQLEADVFSPTATI